MRYASANHFFSKPYGCHVSGYTNPVTLPPVTADELKSGIKKGVNFSVNYHCGGALIFAYMRQHAGVGPGMISVAFNTNNPTLGITGTWSPYIVSDNYGQEGYASNFGISVSVDDQLVGFITHGYTDDYTNPGWFSIRAGETSYSYNTQRLSLRYHSQFFSFYGIINLGRPVTPGKIEATANIIVRYW